MRPVKTVKQTHNQTYYLKCLHDTNSVTYLIRYIYFPSMLHTDHAGLTEVTNDTTDHWEQAKNRVMFGLGSG